MNPALVAEPGPASRPWLTAAHVLLFSALALGVGALTGVAWWAWVDPPAYRVNADGGASTTERGLASYLAGDAWFVVIGLVVGVALGVAAWRFAGRSGWPVVVLAVVLALAAGLVCWDVGYHLGPGEFNPRLAAARPGDLVPVELTLRAWPSLLTWPLFALVPVLLAASLGRDDEEPHASSRPRRDRLSARPRRPAQP